MFVSCLRSGPTGLDLAQLLKVICVLQVRGWGGEERENSAISGSFMDKPCEHSKMHRTERSTTYKDLERFLTQTMKSGLRKHPQVERFFFFVVVVSPRKKELILLLK